jgi:2'-5' RNA ligase
LASGQARHRIFVAVRLAPALVEAIAGVRAVLGETAARLRWVPPDNLHLTLRFLGSITTAALEKVIEATGEAAGETAPFVITLAGMGAFPSRRAPRVVWVGVTDGADRLVALAGALEGALRQRRVPRADRPFQPHLTVARARADGHGPDLSAILPDAAACVVGTQRVAEIAVMESTLRPSGVIYREVATERLRGGG